jgi:hypothetical protein
MEDLGGKGDDGGILNIDNQTLIQLLKEKAKELK